MNSKWTQLFDGVVRANSTLRLLAQVLKDKPTEICATDQKGIAGEAIFLRAHYHFEALQFWGNIPYFREDDTDCAQGVGEPDRGRRPTS